MGNLGKKKSLKDQKRSVTFGDLSDLGSDNRNNVKDGGNEEQNNTNQNNAEHRDNVKGGRKL